MFFNLFFFFFFFSSRRRHTRLVSDWSSDVCSSDLLGPFGDGLLELGGGWFDRSDLDRPGADWVEPLSITAFDRTLHTIPPNSQGYLLLGSALLVDGLTRLPADPDDVTWAHLLVEAAKAAGRDRPDVLADDADGSALVEAIA